MIIVTGSIIAKEDCLEELLSESLAHVHRSRTEAGCISHNVCQDAENPLRLVFIEEWLDSASLFAHFKVEGSRDFIKKVRELAAQTPEMNIFEATEIKL